MYTNTVFLLICLFLMSAKGGKGTPASAIHASGLPN